jgi:hypothetical protein
VNPGDLDDVCAKLRDAHADPERLKKKAEKMRAAAARFDWERERATLLAAVSGGLPEKRPRPI